MNTSSCISIPETQIPVSRSVDVLVLGAGPAGCAAAITAARTGAKTLLVDSASVPGGMTTTGMMSHYTGTVDSKLYEEVLRENARRNHVDPGQRKVQIDPTQHILTWIDLLEAAGAEMLMYTFACEPISHCRDDLLPSMRRTCRSQGNSLWCISTNPLLNPTLRCSSVTDKLSFFYSHLF